MTYIQKFDPTTATSITDMARRIMNTNLCKEIVLSPTQMCTLGYPKTTIALKKLMPKYQFSRAKWYEAEFGPADYNKVKEVREWCVEQFGPEPRHHDAWSRWYHKNHNRIFFRDEKDYHWFILRWGA
jgi:hypothetical protein